MKTVIGNGITIQWNEAGGGARPEDVLRLVLERVNELDRQLFCAENTQIRYHVEQALYWEQVRNERRAQQGVQGTMKAHA